MADKDRPHAGRVADLLGMAAGAASTKAGDPRYIAADDREFIALAKDDAAMMRSQLPKYARMMGIPESDAGQTVPAMCPIAVLLRFMDLVQLVPPEAMDKPAAPSIPVVDGLDGFQHVIGLVQSALRWLEQQAITVNGIPAQFAIIAHDDGPRALFVVSDIEADELEGRLRALREAPTACDAVTKPEGGFITPGNEP